MTGDSEGSYSKCVNADLAQAPSRLRSRWAHVCGAVEEKFRDDTGKARRVGLYLCRHHTGCRLSEIGERFGVSGSAVTQANWRVARELDRDPALRAVVQDLEQELAPCRVEF